MKRTGLLIFTIGLLMALFPAFDFITSEKFVDVGAIEITGNQSHRLEWSPFIGVAVMVFGAVAYFLGRRQQNYSRG